MQVGNVPFRTFPAAVVGKQAGMRRRAGIASRSLRTSRRQSGNRPDTQTDVTADSCFTQLSAGGKVGVTDSLDGWTGAVRRYPVIYKSRETAGNWTDRINSHGRVWCLAKAVRVIHVGGRHGAGVRTCPKYDNGRASYLRTSHNFVTGGRIGH